MTNPQHAAARRARLENDVREIDADTLGVVLQEGSLAILDREDYADLQARGLLGRMYLVTNAAGTPQVKMKVGTRSVPVARLLLRLTHDQQVVYRNRSRLDLRRANLGATHRYGTMMTPQETAAALFPNSIDDQIAWLRLRDARRSRPGQAGDVRTLREVAAPPKPLTPIQQCAAAFALRTL